MPRLSKEAVSQNVVFIGLSGYSGVGGIQSFNRRVVRSLTDAGNLKAAIFLADNPDHAEAELGPNSLVQGCRGRRLKFIDGVIASLRGARVLLVGHINLLPIAAACKALRPSLCVILFVHGIEVWNEELYRKRRLYDRTILRRFVDVISGVSRYTLDRMNDEFGLEESKQFLLPNAVDYQPVRGSGKRKGNLVLSVSRLGWGERAKNLDKLVYAMSSVCRGIEQASLVIVGDGPLKAELATLVNSLGLQDSVRLAGRVSDRQLEELYEEASIFVLPSSKEGFGIVYLEAWAHSLPVIGSCFGGSAEVISDGVDGFAIDPSDVEGLAAQISLLLEDRDLAHGFAVAGRQKVETIYSHESFSRKLLELCSLS